MSKYLIIIALVCVHAVVGKQYRMLVTSVGVSGSNNMLMYRLAEHLAERGHDVRGGGTACCIIVS
jgi:hypothetical protein